MQETEESMLPSERDSDGRGQEPEVPIGVEEKRWRFQCVDLSGVFCHKLCEQESPCIVLANHYTKMSCHCIVFRSIKDSDDYLGITESDPYENSSVRVCDQMLYRALRKLFRNQCRNSEEIRQLLRTPVNRNNKNSIFKQILRLEPNFCRLFEKRINLSLLWFAVLNYYQKSAELLVRSGADVNEFYGSDKSSPKLTKKSIILRALLQMYPSEWNERFIGLVLDHGADLQAREIDHTTILYAAVRISRVKVAEMLLKKGADVHAATDFYSVIHSAALCRKVNEMVPLLMKYGADIKVRDVDGRNVLVYLAKNFFTNEVVDLARDLIQKGVLPCEVKGSERNQPIHWAVLTGKNALLNLYLDHGANVNAYTRRKRFPLYIAAKHCEDPTVLLTLLKRGANIDLRTWKGYTALHSLAAGRSVSYWSEESTLRKMKILLSVGADMFVESDAGLTPFEIIRRTDMENPSIRLMLKTLALKRACQQPSIELEEEQFFKEYPKLWSYYKHCLEEIDKIKSTKLFMPGTLFELLTKCQCQMVELMRYHEFESGFRIYDLNEFPVYAEDMLEAFARAEYYYRLVLEKEELISEAFYYYLSYLIVRKLIGYTANCEICEMKKIVRESRRANEDTAEF